MAVVGVDHSSLQAAILRYLSCVF